MDPLPCPFCGGEPVSFSHRSLFNIECRDCVDNITVCVSALNIPEALRLWNTRAPAREESE